mmetsp:Transcript_15667/g.36720  ORF Transcript_15667/g.36720 Transcript_15667/m.36720 type:complete len:1155 (-) Transcript_15667:95-3559(-)|eukprot:CAMPEP_0178401404 /NCGR_PEP_ID=MMETSP0689_2-20121128/16285_1 /TAXON_ID=160604 /ORGANISM="Amphidinium massartii, Strain CS-259" /LENGTH=1154 /DNA_ID=CAMNT_0020022225 /DNA_START=82 /DNA_END=3546 /DNA_ORIENTATION=+
MSASEQHWNFELLNLAAGLQKHQHNGDKGEEGLEVPVPQFILIGPQSIGKTRLLSCIAACKLGGAEQAGTGTRCPVVYSFLHGDERQFKVGKSEAMSDCDQGYISKFLTEHMERLGKSEQQTKKPGFSNQPVFVEVRGPHVPCFTVVDLPGLKKPNPDKEQFITACNRSIRDMYKTFYRNPHTVSIVLTQFETSMDVGETEASLNNFVREAELPDNLCREAVVFISRLDAVQKDLKVDHMKKFLKHLQTKSFRKERVILATLKPELLGSSDSIEEHDSDSYFEHQRGKLESDLLKAWVGKRGMGSAGCKFGFQALRDSLTEELESKIHRNSTAIYRWLQDMLEKALHLAERMLLPFDETMLLQIIPDYVRLYGAALAGAATRHDMQRFLDSKSFLTQLKEKYPHSVGLSTEQLTKEVLKATARKFDEEKSDMLAKAQVKPEAWVISDATERVVKSRAASLPEELQCDLSLGGASAVRRFLQRQGIAVMTQPLREFTLAELLDKKGSDMSYDKTVGPDWQRVVRSMIEEMAPVQQQSDVMVNWCENIYASQVEGVCKVLRDHVHLLHNYPGLRDLIDKCIALQYSDALHRIATEATRIISNLSTQSFQLLNLDNVVHLQTLVHFTMGKLFLGGCILPPVAADVEPGSLDKFFGNFQAQERVCMPGLLAVDFMPKFQQLLQEMMQEPKKGMPGRVADMLAGTSEQTNHREIDLVLSLIQPTGFRLEYGVVKGPLGNVQTRQKSLNDVAQAVARLHLGLAFQMSKEVIYNLFEDQVSQIPNDIPASLDSIARVLLQEKHKKFLHALISGSSGAGGAQMAEVTARIENLVADIAEMKHLIPELDAPSGRSENSRCGMLLNKAERLLPRLSKSALSENSAEEVEPQDLADLQAQFMLDLKEQMRGARPGQAAATSGAEQGDQEKLFHELQQQLREVRHELVKQKASSDDEKSAAAKERERLVHENQRMKEELERLHASLERRDELETDPDELEADHEQERSQDESDDKDDEEVDSEDGDEDDGAAGTLQNDQESAHDSAHAHQDKDSDSNQGEDAFDDAEEDSEDPSSEVLQPALRSRDVDYAAGHWMSQKRNKQASTPTKKTTSSAPSAAPQSTPERPQSSRSGVTDSPASRLSTPAKATGRKQKKRDTTSEKPKAYP